MPRSVTAIEIVWRNPWVRAITYVLAAILLVALLVLNYDKYAFVLQVAIIGFVLAYILNPVVEAMQRVRLSRGLAVVLIYIVLLQLLVLGSVLISQVVVQTGEFVRLLPSAIENITPFAERVMEWLSGWRENLPDFLRERFGVETTGTDSLTIIEENVTAFLSQVASGFNRTLNNVISNSGNYLLTGVTSILSTTFQVFLILLTSAYFLYDFPRFTASFRRYVPVRWRPLYTDLVDKTDQAVGGYMRGQLLITTIVGIVIWLGLTIIGVPLALAISFLAAIFNLVPYLGPIIGGIPAVLLAFTVSPWAPLWTLIVFIAANQLEGHVLGPFILSKSTNLHPVTVLLAILAGAGLFGLVGALLAVPIVAFVKVVLEEYLLTRPAYRDEATPEMAAWEAAAGVDHSEVPAARPGNKPAKSGD